MSTFIPQRELRNHNAQIIERVRAGESFTVTRDGVPVADVTPHQAEDRPPLFRTPRELRHWAPLTRDGAGDWLADIRREDTRLDESLRDPWNVEER